MVATQGGSDAPQTGWKHFQLVEQAARLGYWRLAIATETIFWSEGYCRLFGIEPGQGVPSLDVLRDQLQPDDLAAMQQKMKQAIRTKTSFFHRARFRDPNAPVQFLDTFFEPEIDDQGEVAAIVGVCKDVTGEVKAEAARAAAQLRYEIMAEEATDIIVLHDGNKLLCASRAVERLLGRKAEDMQHGRYLSIVHPDDLAEAKKLEGAPPPGVTWTATYRLRHAHGHYLWMEVSTRGLYDETGQLRYEISVGRDVTERKRQELAMRAAQERAEAASRAKSQFLAHMSHELRTPLNAIMGFADMMRLRLLGDPKDGRYEDYASLIYNSAQILLSHISGILEMANIERGRLSLKFGNVALRPLISACVDAARPRAAERGVELEFACPHDLSIQADAAAIDQVLFHLVSNALKFTSAGGRVVVDAHEVAERSVICVKDNGVGIAAADLPRLGLPFEQVASDPHKAKGSVGTGVGLALARALIENHGGKLWIESVLGEGTRVYIELPRSAAVRAA